MSCKSGNKAHKERCKQYKAEGRRELNKKKKQERHLHRMEKFREKMERRKAAGKEYKYDKKRTEEKYKNHIPVGTNLNSGKRSEFAEWDSICTFLDKCYEEEKKKMTVKKEDRKEA